MTVPDPGDRRLERPPSDRYSPPPGPTTSGSDRRRASRAIVRAVLVADAGILAIVLVGGILAMTSGLIVIVGLAGAGIGLVLAEATLEEGGPPALSRPSATRLAALLGVAMVVGGAVLTWALSRVEGGVLGPLDYLWTVFGLLVPVQAVVAALAAWWGASVGPVRGRG